MKSFNHVVLVGNVGKEPVSRTVTTEKDEAVKVCQFSLAVDAGKDKDNTLWLSVVAWRRLAEQVKRYVHTGDLVLVEGKLSVRSYTDHESRERTAVEVIASDIRFLQAKQATHETAREHPTPAEPAVPAAA
jgi:single-strand DNA-binding protein